MSSLRLLVLLVVWITVVGGEPLRQRKIHFDVDPSPALSPMGRNFLTEASVGHVLLNSPSEARLFRTIPEITPLSQRLADNYTIVVPNLLDTFRCNDRVYGYYADMDNDCKIFHVCLPLRQLFPANFTEDITYIFSFFCPEYTIFSQDSMTCAWEEEALPCYLSSELYWLNENFFRKENDDYVELNAPLPNSP